MFQTAENSTEKIQAEMWSRFRLFSTLLNSIHDVDAMFRKDDTQPVYVTICFADFFAAALNNLTMK